MYEGIEGFTYKEGYEYVLEIKRVELEESIAPIADGSSMRYILVKEISKTKR
ncbi:DUF4377 domain-containing protein [Myroides sp. M-43]|uniref:DUF4377 domain-containing protein n=1 Tax=Myroides oncorhynchi TaxID=2893756 RepID=UPI001E3501B6|nr:DUF4377 domain-containing protein [Myroides oncorhynchi]MCC9043618.1 DUF4377 domain-containing protein [Myroides oncorhynchi]